MKGPAPTATALLALGRTASSFSVSSLQSLINSNVDDCMSNPADWLHPTSISGESPRIHEVLPASHNQSLLWGTYQPNRYFCVKSRTAPASLVYGMMWHGAGGKLAGSARCDCSQDDRLRRYGYTHHDGTSYGRQVIEDPQEGADFVTEYVRLNDDNTQWGSRIAVQPQDRGGQDQEDGAVLYVYFGLDCDGAVSPEGCLGVAGSQGLKVQLDRAKDRAEVYIHGRSKDHGVFTLNVGVYSSGTNGGGGSPLSISYMGLADVMAADVKDRVDRAQRSIVFDRMQGAKRSSVKSVALTDTMPSADTNMVVLRVEGAGPFVVDAVLRGEDMEEDEPYAGEAEKICEALDKATAEGRSRFEKRFAEVFGLSSKGYKGRSFTPEELEAGKAAFSNLVGGMGYSHGRTVIKGSGGSGTLQSFPTSLFTAVPSRSFFPRGFLWDEGFHQLVIHQWDIALTYDSAMHWLAQLHHHSGCAELGWIPREISIGEQALRRIPKEFLPQDVHVANPPTWLLTIERLLDMSGVGDNGASTHECSTTGQCPAEGAEVRSRRQAFFAVVKPRVERWVRWLLSSQRGPVSGSFRWHGRDDSQHKLIATTFGSGLDDYPRASEPGGEEYHVDILCWVAKSCQVLARLSHVVGDADGKARFEQAAAEALEALDALHWNETLQGYFDYGLHSEDGSIVQTVPVRCGRTGTTDFKDVQVPTSALQDNRNPCPPDYPEPLGLLSHDPRPTYIRGPNIAPQHVPRIGYVSIFPFLLELLPSESPRLGAILAVIRDPNRLWSPHGLRSLSANDRFYRQENAPGDAPYWRGFIWININYLALRALQRLSAVPGPHQQQAQETYVELRDDLLSTILSQYMQTKYFWEQYDDATGRGLRSHPFTGWTSLVVNIMAELY